MHARKVGSGVYRLVMHIELKLPSVGMYHMNTIKLHTTLTHITSNYIIRSPYTHLLVLLQDVGLMCAIFLRTIPKTFKPAIF
jgi:hypothetical protein